MVEAIERASASVGTDDRAVAAVVYPLVEAHGIDAVLVVIAIV
jgi:hypothetical protein